MIRPEFICHTYKGTVGTILAELYLCWAGYPVKDYSNMNGYEYCQYNNDSMDYFGMGCR